MKWVISPNKVSSYKVLTDSPNGKEVSTSWNPGLTILFLRVPNSLKILDEVKIKPKNDIETTVKVNDGISCFKSCDQQEKKEI